MEDVDRFFQYIFHRNPKISWGAFFWGEPDQDQ